MYRFALVAAVLLVGCFKFYPAPVEVEPLKKAEERPCQSIQYMTKPYDAKSLYVCGTLPDGKFSCIEYEDFMAAMSKQQPTSQSGDISL